MKDLEQKLIKKSMELIKLLKRKIILLEGIIQDQKDIIKIHERK